MSRWFIALLWLALLVVIAVTVWPKAQPNATAETKADATALAQTDATPVARILKFMADNEDHVREALCVALAALAAYLVLYAFVIDSDEFIPLDWVARLLWPFVYLLSPTKQTSATSRGIAPRVLYALGWPFALGTGVLSFFFKDLIPGVQHGLAALLGFLCIAAIMKALRRGRSQSSRPYGTAPRRTIVIEELVFAGAWIVFVWAVGLAVWTDQLTKYAEVGAIVLFGTLALAFACCGLTLLSRNQLFAVENNWGGLGGGVGGWRVSLPVVLLLAAVFFAGATVAVTRPPAPSSGTKSAKTDTKSDTKAGSSATPSSSISTAQPPAGATPPSTAPEGR